MIKMGKRLAQFNFCNCCVLFMRLADLFFVCAQTQDKEQLFVPKKNWNNKQAKNEINAN